MAKIQPVKTLQNRYDNLYGENYPVGKIVQMSQSAAIRDGYEIENHIINARKNHNVIRNLKLFIENIYSVPEGTYICPKSALNYKTFFIAKQPDFLVFKIDKNKKCKITEMKSGCNFDTKKAQGEINSLKECCTEFKRNVKKITGKTIDVDYQICSFDAKTKEQMVNGFKCKISLEHCITGKSFCRDLGINYKKITQKRQNDIRYNRVTACNELMQPEFLDDAFCCSGFHKYLKEKGLMICECA